MRLAPLNRWMCAFSVCLLAHVHGVELTSTGPAPTAAAGIPGVLGGGSPPKQICSVSVSKNYKK